MSTQPYLANLAHSAEQTLRPLANIIDKAAHYPREFMHAYGEKGGFAAHGDKAFSGLGYGIATQVEAIATLGRICGSTAFNAWCQTTCAWYIQNSSNRALKNRYLSDVLQAKTLAGTGLSNTMKSLAGIEKHSLSATADADGYRINGSLRAVTNIGESHIFAATAEIDGGGLVMFLIEGNQSGVTLNDGIEFCALNGTQTLGVHCDNIHIPATQILATSEQFDAYLSTIKSGFVMLQLGMALGALYAAADIMADSNAHIAELNQFLPHGYEAVQQDITTIKTTTQRLAEDIHNPEQFLAVLQLRLLASEAVLAASQSAALHAGAMGYTATHHAQRLSREALFVAIITPSVKHLKKEIHRLEKLQQCA